MAKEIKRLGANGRRSTAVVYDNTVYVAGITSTNIEGDITAQLQDIFAQIDALLARCGTDKNKVVMATITLADMADYGAFNAVWDEWVIDGFEPARSVTEGKLALQEYKAKVAVIAAV